MHKWDLTDMIVCASQPRCTRLFYSIPTTIAHIKVLVELLIGYARTFSFAK